MRIDCNSFNPPTNKPLFITFEGINGCGKTTLHRAVSEKLRSSSIAVCDTREPGGTPLGVELRKLLLEWRGEKKSDRAELLLFAADRAEHIDKVIQPALSQGRWVLCDRFIFSTIAFQGAGRGIQLDWIEHANALAIQGTLPDLVVLIDLDPTEALHRISLREGNGNDALEAEEISFHTRIRQGFLDCADSSPVPFLVLDGSKKPLELLNEVWNVLSLKQKIV